MEGKFVTNPNLMIQKTFIKVKDDRMFKVEMDDFYRFVITRCNYSLNRCS